MNSNNKNTENLLFENQPIGYSLEQNFYNDPNFFDADIKRVLAKQWLYVDHINSIPKKGDYITYQFADESIIIIRGKYDQIYAHFNVCRHRGSRLCSKEKGHTAKLICPYHAWVYDIEGPLRAAKQMPEGFDPLEHSLHPCRVEVLEGLIFINIDSNDASDFELMSKNIHSFVKPHGMTNAKIAHTRKYHVDANWKLVVENFRECYHCSPSHPEYASVNEYVHVGDRELGGYIPTVEAWKKANISSDKELGFKNFDYDLQPHHAWRMPIREGFKTASKDGQPVAPLMGDFLEYDNAETGIFFSPLSYFYLNNDYATAFRVTPLSTNETEVCINWFVEENAIEGEDYQVEDIIWLWDVTTIQDKKIVNENQIGVNSSRYTPGPYSLREYGTADFTAWYLARLQNTLETRTKFR